MSFFAVGDPRFDEGPDCATVEDLCDGQSREGFLCTRLKDHEPPCVANGITKIMAVWG